MGGDQTASIRQKAEALYGMTLGENGDLLVSIAAQRALAHCGRSDIPEEMEQAVAALAVFLAGGGEAVKSLTRGDTSISYDTAASAPLALLEPWRKLATVKPNPGGEKAVAE